MCRASVRRVNLLRIRWLEAKINKLASKYTGHSSEASAALVVFNNKESWRRCVQDYSLSKYWLGRRVQANALKMRRKHALQVEPAAEPDMVRWQHLDTPWWSRFLRRSCTNVVVFLFILATLLSIVYCQVKRDVRAWCYGAVAAALLTYHPRHRGAGVP